MLFNWFTLRVEINLEHAHKTRFGYLLRVFSKFSDEHPRHFYGVVPLVSPVMKAFHHYALY